MIVKIIIEFLKIYRRQKLEKDLISLFSFSRKMRLTVNFANNWGKKTLGFLAILQDPKLDTPCGPIILPLNNKHPDIEQMGESL